MVPKDGGMLLPLYTIKIYIYIYANIHIYANIYRYMQSMYIYISIYTMHTPEQRKQKGSLLMFRKDAKRS